MKRSDQATQSAGTDYTPAVPLEISGELAGRIDDLLRDLAEDAGLETVLVVDRSGALVSGISAEEEVTVEVISALVAGASGAIRALVTRLGEEGEFESIHLGETRTIYLREMAGRFALVGVSTGEMSAGAVREKARQVKPSLIALLEEIKVTEPVPVQQRKVSSLRAVALERAAARAEVETDEEASSRLIEEGAVDEPSGTAEKPSREVLEAETSDREEFNNPEGPIDSEDSGTPEPKEIIEIIGLDDPEVVIEESRAEGASEKMESPFEIEEEDEEGFEEMSVSSQNVPVESIFEIDGIDQETPSSRSAGEEGEIPEDVFEMDEDTDLDEEPDEGLSLFEIDDSANEPETVEDEEANLENVFEWDDDDADEDVEEEVESDDSEGSLEESQPSGPRYF